MDKAFRLVEFRNRSGSTAWRVTGWRKGGVRVRENFPTRPQAEARRHELEVERLGHQTFETLRATWLSREQLQAAEAAFHRLHEPAELSRAVEFWIRRGKALAAPVGNDTGLDEAADRFQRWLDGRGSFRAATKRNLRYRVAMFASEVGDQPLAEITPETVEAWIERRKVSPTTRRNDLRAVGRFFAWCIERPQRFITHNPVREVRLDDESEKGAPEIYTLREVTRLLVAAKRFRSGRFLPFIVLQLFGGLRPTEALRFQSEQVRDGALRIEANQSKVRRSRTIDVDPVLTAWLALCPAGAPVSDPQKSKLLWGQLRAKARLSRWIPDGLRHTAISHYFRRCGSYGQSAEWAGNSEAVIKEHYQARTTAAETAKFWSLFPLREQRKGARREA